MSYNRRPKRLQVGGAAPLAAPAAAGSDNDSDDAPQPETGAEAAFPARMPPRIPVPRVPAAAKRRGRAEPGAAAAFAAGVIGRGLAATTAATGAAGAAPRRRHRHTEVIILTIPSPFQIHAFTCTHQTTTNIDAPQPRAQPRHALRPAVGAARDVGAAAPRPCQCKGVVIEDGLVE